MTQLISIKSNILFYIYWQLNNNIFKSIMFFIKVVQDGESYQWSEPHDLKSLLSFTSQLPQCYEVNLIQNIKFYRLVYEDCEADQIHIDSEDDLLTMMKEGIAEIMVERSCEAEGFAR